MKKIAFVNQRYGREVNGGSEYYTMQMAQKLKEYYEVEVLTSKALTYDRWEDYYTQDVEQIDGVTVRRFSVKRKRNRYMQRILKILITRFGMNTIKLTGCWNKVLGPYIHDLVSYIEEHEKEYAAFIFVTYMYYPVVFGMEKAAEKAVFVPTAHDEYNIYFKIYERLFHLPRKIVYLTQEEKEFVQRHFHNEEVDYEVMGVGVDLPEAVSGERFREKYHIEGEYLIYAGRVDADKGCGEMFAYFQTYAERYKSSLQLVVIGKAYMDIPDADNIHYLGFLPEEDKYDAIEGADLLWLPSRHESLSIAVLEAMALGTPVIVNGQCEVLKGHCVRSGGGVWYSDGEEFAEVLKKTVEDKDKYYSFCKNARQYTGVSYQWDKIILKWRTIIEKV